MKKHPSWKMGVAGSALLLTLAFAVAVAARGVGPAVSVIVPSILLEVVAGAVASIPLGFDPVSGAVVASVANLAPVPILLTAFDALVRKWKWLGKRLEKAQRIGDKYGKYGVWVLAPLAPFIGVYVAVAVGIGLNFRMWAIFASTAVGVVVSGFVTTFGGEGIRHLFGM